MFLVPFKDERIFKLLGVLILSGLGVYESIYQKYFSTNVGLAF